MPWDQNVTHGFTEVGDQVEAVTMKEKVNAAGEVTDVLLAPGHVADIQPDLDHLHAWNQEAGGVPDHHDLRDSPPMFPG